jgi:hypothetical protein
VLTKRGREKGVVEKTDFKRLWVFYRNKAKELRYAHINSVMYLGDKENNWLG